MKILWHPKYVIFVICTLGLILKDKGLVAQSPKSNYQPKVSVKIQQIGDYSILPSGQFPNGRKEIVFDKDFVDNGVDFKLEVSKSLYFGDKNVWLFIQQPDESYWRAYGPAKKRPDGFWEILGVKFAMGVFYGRRYNCRAVAFSRHNNSDAFPSAFRLYKEGIWTTNVKAASEPVSIIIRKLDVKAERSELELENSQIWISTIDNHTISHYETTLVPAKASIVGTVQLANKRPAKEFYLYVGVHPSSVNKRRIFGPAIIHNQRWEIPDVQIVDPSQLYTTHYGISAILTSSPLDISEPMNYTEWQSANFLASNEIEVSVRPPKIALKPPHLPEVNIAYLDTIFQDLDSEYLYYEEEIIVDSLEQLIAAGGSFKRLPQGASIWLLASPKGSSNWEVYGKALINGNNWYLPLTHEKRIKIKSSGIFQFLAIISWDPLPRGILSYDQWSEKRLANSKTLIVRETNGKVPEHTVKEIAITKIGGKKVRDFYFPINFPRNSQVEGKIEGVYSKSILGYVGFNPKGSQEWLFSGPIHISNKKWWIGSLDFGKWENQMSDSIRQGNLMVIATMGTLPTKELKLGDIQKYAIRRSSLVQIPNQVQNQLKAELQGVLNFVTFLLPLLIKLGLVLVILLLLNRFKGQLSVMGQIFKGISTLCKKILNWLEKLFPGVQEMQIKPNTILFSTVLLTAVIITIINYFPIYRFALEKVYGLDFEKSRSLAIMIIFMIAIAGILFHVLYDWKELFKKNITQEKEDEEEAPPPHITKAENVYDQLSPYFKPTLLVFIAFLLIVQIMTYFIFYRDYQEAGVERSAMMAVVVGLIGFTEFAIFLWGLALGTDFITKLIFFTLCGPFAFMGWIFDSMAAFFSSSSPNKDSLPAGKNKVESSNIPINKHPIKKES